MDILQPKADLKLKGYCQFNLKDLNENSYNVLKRSLICNSEKNIKERFNQIRADYTLDSKQHHIQDTFKSFEDANLAKEDILKKYSSGEITNLMQVWYHTSMDNIYNNTNDVFEDGMEFQSFIDDIYTEIVHNFFEHHIEDEISNIVDFTYYDNGCRLDNHSDGTGTGRICACLIYLNESYDKNDGGYLVLNNTEIVLPTFGNVAIIDLEKFDVPHCVTEVTGGIGRYAMLSFCKKKGDKFI